MVNLKKIVIHEIKKEPGTKEAEPEFSANCLDSKNPIRIDLATKLAETFRRRRDKIDLADVERDSDFSNILTKYINIETGVESSEEEFLDFSKKATNQLLELMESAVASKGGYLIFTEYFYQQIEYISIYLVRDTEGSLFKPIDGVLDVESTLYADIEKLAMACRINVGQFLRVERTPMMIIHNKTKEVSEYFTKWLGANDRESSEQLTETLLSVIRNMEPPPSSNDNIEKKQIDEKDAEKEQFDRANEIKKTVYDIVNSNIDKNANLNVISLQVYGDEDAINNYLDKHQIDMPSEFKVSGTALKKFIQVSAKSGGLTLQFPTGDYLNKVKLSGEGNKIIIDSAEIYDAVKEQIGDIE